MPRRVTGQPPRDPPRDLTDVHPCGRPWSGVARGRGRVRERVPARITEPGGRPELASARGTDTPERRAAFLAELRPFPILVAAAGAIHRRGRCGINGII